MMLIIMYYQTQILTDINFNKKKKKDISMPKKYLIYFSCTVIYIVSKSIVIINTDFILNMTAYQP